MTAFGLEGDRLHRLVDGFRDRRVAVLGDMVADEFVYGDIARVSREAPVLILEHRRTESVPGGGGNAVANLRALGAEPFPVGVVGHDEPGTRLLACFESLGISTSGLKAVRGYETPAKSRIIAGGVHTRRQQLVRVDRGAAHGDLSTAARTSLAGRLKQVLNKVDGLLVADYGYGSATPETVDEARNGIDPDDSPVVVDSRTRTAAYRRLSACTPNQEELEQALGLDGLQDDSAFEAAGRKLLRLTGHGAVLVTRGARGMCLLSRRRPMRVIAAYGSDEVADVTGAGDTVIAVFTLARICGARYLEAAVLANYAAGLVVMKAGTATVSAEELHGAIEEETD